jgi:hypothetical protein
VSKALFPSVVHNEPKNFSSHPADQKINFEPQDHPAMRNFCKNQGADRGDVLIHGLWAQGIDCIIDIHITDVDAKSNCSKRPDRVLIVHEKEKKTKYLEACLKQCRHFTPFVVSTNGLLGKEAKTLLKKILVLLAEKWEKLYLEVCGYVNARMSIAIVRATHLCLPGSRVPTSQMCNRRPQWKDKAGLSLFHQ